jgi:hypothetical protein
VSEDEDYRIKPTDLLGLPKHECVLVHGDQGYRRGYMPPMEADGTVSAWYRWWGWAGKQHERRASDSTSPFEADT